LLQANAGKKPAPGSDTDDEYRERLVGLRGARAASFNVNNQVKGGIFRGTIVLVLHESGKSLQEDTFEILFDNDGERQVLDLVELYDALALYMEVGEETEEENKLDWVAKKRETSKNVQACLLKKFSKIQKRQEELDAILETEGSIAKVLGIPPLVQRGKKRSRPSDGKHPNPQQFVSKRIAKWFEGPDPDDPTKSVSSLFFGTIDYISNQEGKETWWHVTYDDDDMEDFDIRQVRQGIADYEKNKSKDPKNNQEDEKAEAV